MHRLNYIDALRGLAILMVILHHADPYFAGISLYKLPPLLRVIATNGDKGVTLFFVMSAFTLCLSLRQKMLMEKKPVRNYFIRRLFRIAPMYYLVIFLFLILQIGTPSTASFFFNVLMLHGLNPYWINSTVPGGWTVGIEVLFYLILPLLFFKVRTTAAALNVTILLLLLSKLTTSLMFKYPLIPDRPLWGLFIYENIISQLPVFLVGICLFNLTGPAQTPGTPWIKNPFTIILAGVFLLLNIWIGNILKDYYLYAIAFGLLACLLMKFKSILFINKFTIATGKVSYSLYLIHLLVTNLLVKYGLTHYGSSPAIDYVLRFCIILSTSFGLSLLSYKYIETPFIGFGKQLIERLEHNGAYLP